jgi:hypothetical protein
MRTCPYCREQTDAADTKCPHCLEWLDGRPRGGRKVVQLAIGIGVGLLLGATIVGRVNQGFHGPGSAGLLGIVVIIVLMIFLRIRNSASSS